MYPGAVVRRVLGMLGALVLSGCSAIFVSGPPSDHAQLQYFDCSSDWAGPATDGMFGVTYGLVTVMAAANPESVSGDGEFFVLAGALSAAFLGSMAYGVLETSDCSQAKEALQRRLAQRAERAEVDARRIQELEARLKQADSQRPDATVPAPVLAPAPPPPLEMPTPAPAAPVAPPATDPPPSGPLP